MRTYGLLPVVRWSSFFIVSFLAVLSFSRPALAGGDCTPDAGFEWCYQEASWPPAFCKIQVDIDYNTEVVKGYKVSAKQFAVRFKSSGTTYYGSGAWSCSQYGGCSGENLGGGVSTKVVASSYTSSPKVEKVSCHHGAGGWWCWAGYGSWNAGVHVVHCYNDSHCGNCQHCSTSGSPSNWKCVTDSEVCDGADNDCDGSIDEGFDVGNPCTVGTGECVNSGSKICTGNGSGTTCSANPLPPTSEKCDGKDNDCDASVDEDFNLSQVCEVGVGSCLNIGINVCKDDQSGAECSVGPLPSTPEECDGVDNDCDGSADELWEILGDACEVGVGECLHAGVFECTDDGTDTQCSVTPHPPSLEVCDAKDNDCDGSTDEDFDLGDQCLVGIGECLNEGVKVCMANALGTECSVQPFPPTDELCDGLDNNCDGSEDESFPTKGLPCDGADTDFCENGMWTCSVNGLDVECINETITDIVDICDGLDNDCDGEADEDFDAKDLPCDGADTDLCENGAFTCTEDGIGVECVNETITDIVEVCDYFDNDCDGQEDEDFPVLTDECWVGVGECFNIGEVICNADGSGTECSEQPLPPSDEVCDGKDNNCDGEEDEELGTTTCGLGVCLHTVDNCVGGIAQVCDEWAGAGVEICDGKDNNCDGSTDEDFHAKDLPCDGADADLCENGTFTCTEDGSGVECVNETITDIVDICDGLDNDCDDSIDEEFSAKDLPCDGADADSCENGTWTCTEEGLGVECVNETVTDIVDICDGLDNDCDDSIDEDFHAKDLPCDGADADLCENGTFTCTEDGAGVECVNETITDIVDMCDGLDNDCDGEVDEDLGTTTCGLGVCLHTVDNCVDGVDQICDEWAGVGVEDCDGLDNDCDGEVDEELGSTTCGVGVCLHTVENCVGGIAQICNAEEGVALEKCDGLDNDCNGETDEGFGTTTCGVGVCLHTVENCAGGIAQVCDEWEGVGIEECDGMDNDCDGDVDEDFLEGDPCFVDVWSAAQPYAPSGDFTQDGEVDIVDMQCLVMTYQSVKLADAAGVDLCADDAQCEADVGDGWNCRAAFAENLACFPSCLHPVVSFGESAQVVCDDPEASDHNCLGTVQKRSLDMNCDGQLTAVDFNFLVALVMGKVGGAGTADEDNDGQLNHCDPDG